jgi:lipopolysaccharide assembly outer membrane protein LptD (OstA)
VRRARLVAAALAGLAVALAAPAEAQPPVEPPLQISADNMTGGRGPEGDIVFLNGNLRITRGRTLITADAGRYLRTLGLLHLERRVTLVDSTTTLTCDRATYNEDSDLLQVEGNVVVRDRGTELRAPSGTYDRRTGRAELTGRVHGRDRDQRLESDRAIYWRDSLVVQARGNVRGYDDQNRLELSAAAVDYDRRTHEALATGDPLLRSKDDDGRIAELRALRLRVNTESRLAEAIDSVTVVRDTLRGRADYALFDDRANRGWLLGRPRVWDDQTTVTGDTIEVWSEKRVVRRVVVRHEAVVDYRGSRPNTVGEASRLSGQRVDVFFDENDIDSLVATGEARNLYTAPPREGRTSETNLATGDTITVFFRDRKIDRARVEGEARGEYRPATDLADTTAQRREVIAYDAVRIEYVVPKSRIVLDRGAHLTYRDLELRSRRVEFDVSAQTLVAQGDPQLTDRGDQVSGHLMTYDLETRVGTIFDAKTAYERGLYHGQRIRKVGENVLDVLHGSYSTCDLEHPHYHFSARWMKIYLKDKLVAKPIVFYVRNVPLLALPFYVFPIKPGRHSGFLFPQVEFGFSDAAGQFVRNAGYYWAPNDYMDLTLSGDYYRAEPSWVMRADGNYKLLYVLQGDVHGEYARNERFANEGWSFRADHNHELSPRTRMTARASFVSSRDYNTSNLYGHSLSQRVNRFLTSSLAVSHAADWASFSAALDRRQDLDADLALQDPDGSGPSPLPAVGTAASLANLAETRPSVSVSFPTRTLGSFPLFKGTGVEKSLASLYASLNARYLEQREQRAFVARRDSSGAVPTNVLDQRVTTRRGAASDLSLSDSRRLFGWINFAPRVNANAVVFDFDEQGHKVVPAAVWNGGLGAGSTFYGTFMPRLGRLAGVRHVVSPNVSFSYSPEFKGLTFRDSNGVQRSRFNPFGSIAISGFRSASMNFSLDQRFQVKWGRPDSLRRLDNLLAWSMSGAYDFLWRERGARHPLSTISSSVVLSPPGVASASLSWATDVYQARPVRTLSWNLQLNLGSGGGRGGTPSLPLEQRDPEAEAYREQWSLGFAYSYAGGYSGPKWTDRQYANATAHYQFSPGWGLDWAASYDVTFHTLTTQRFSLERDLHCWTASFTRTFSLGGEAEYYFRLSVKEQRELYIERGTRTGSIGGIN